MNISYAAKTAFRGLRINKTRSLLTILGIVIGITAVTLVVSIGQGAQSMILDQIQGMGSKTIVILPGRESHGMSESLDTIMNDSLKEKDLEVLKKNSNVPHLVRAMPIVFGSAVVSSGEENYRFSVFGVTSMIAELYDLYPNQGEFFIDEDIAAKADVVVIGETVREKLFGQSKALGERIKIKDRKYRIVGILPKKGQGSLVNFDDILIIPYTNAQSYLMGIKYYNRIVVEADTDLNVEATIADIKRTLRDSHNISDPEKDDFYLMTSSDITQRVKTVTDVLTILLASVAAISLLVGGVGIMNIVLVSVTERTREIGLRKALGATKNDILYQFLLESVILTASGGVVGVVLGTIFSFLASVILSQATGSLWRFSFPYGAALLGFLVSAGVGLIFGVYPARKAAQLNPIEALRYE